MFPPFDSPRHSGTLNELKQLKLVKIIVLETSDYFIMIVLSFKIMKILECATDALVTLN